MSEPLTATYHSPSGEQTFDHALTTPKVNSDGSFDPSTKKNYLSDLRQSSKKLQQDINKFLTEKMEEDKRAIGENGTAKEKSKDELEEENYGEENEDDAA
jgi:hypothetical protein